MVNMVYGGIIALQRERKLAMKMGIVLALVVAASTAMANTEVEAGDFPGLQIVETASPGYEPTGDVVEIDGTPYQVYAGKMFIGGTATGFDFEAVRF